MAFKEIIVDDTSTPSGEYAKFGAIGDEFTGLYNGKRAVPARPNPSDPTRPYRAKTEYLFKNKNGAFIVDPPTALVRRFEQAELAGVLIVGTSICKMKFTSTRPPPPEKPHHSPMKIINLLIDNEFMVAKAAAKASAPVVSDEAY